jgi:predicted PilT family ATPase
VTFVARALSPAKVSSVTIDEQTDEDGQASALVIVPDNQLSLAIGKKGQNARLAAKLTGMRIDIKSESEVETERIDAEAGAAGLATLPEITPERLNALREAGISSPDDVVAAGLERVRALPEIGDDAPEVVAAAERWVAARAEERDRKETPTA